jgi:hypothetical protein
MGRFILLLTLLIAKHLVDAHFHYANEIRQIILAKCNKRGYRAACLQLTIEHGGERDFRKRTTCPEGGETSLHFKPNSENNICSRCKIVHLINCAVPRSKEFSFESSVEPHKPQSIGRVLRTLSLNECNGYAFPGFHFRVGFAPVSPILETGILLLKGNHTACEPHRKRV